MRVSIGQKVRNTLTGYSGIVVSRCEHLDRTTEVRVLDVARFDGKEFPQGPWFPESQLEVDDES